MENHREQERLKIAIAEGYATTSDWQAFLDLRVDMEMYRRHAEKALSWNTNKGNTA